MQVQHDFLPLAQVLASLKLVNFGGWKLPSLGTFEGPLSESPYDRLFLSLVHGAPMPQIILAGKPPSPYCELRLLDVPLSEMGSSYRGEPIVIVGHEVCGCLIDLFLRSKMAAPLNAPPDVVFPAGRLLYRTGSGHVSAGVGRHRFLEDDEISLFESIDFLFSLRIYARERELEAIGIPKPIISEATGMIFAASRARFAVTTILDWWKYPEAMESWFKSMNRSGNADP